MTDETIAYTGATLFDGTHLHRDHALLVGAGRVTGIVAHQDVPQGAKIARLQGGTLAPGFVD